MIPDAGDVGADRDARQARVVLECIGPDAGDWREIDPAGDDQRPAATVAARDVQCAVIIGRVSEPALHRHIRPLQGDVVEGDGVTATCERELKNGAARHCHAKFNITLQVDPAVGDLIGLGNDGGST
jgi:hypothetical protein